MLSSCVCLSVRPSVRLPQADILSKWLKDRAGVWHTRFLSPIIYLVAFAIIKGNSDVAITAVLPSETLSQTLHWRFRQTNRFVLSTNSSTVGLIDHIYDSRCVMAGRTYTLHVRDALIPLLWFVVNLLCNLLLQLCSSVSASRRPRDGHGLSPSLGLVGLGRVEWEVLWHCSWIL